MKNIALLFSVYQIMGSREVIYLYEILVLFGKKHIFGCYNHIILMLNLASGI